jgi:hypothetical protein
MWLVLGDNEQSCSLISLTPVISYSFSASVLNIKVNKQQAVYLQASCTTRSENIPSLR